MIVVINTGKSFVLLSPSLSQYLCFCRAVKSCQTGLTLDSSSCIPQVCLTDELHFSPLSVSTYICHGFHKMSKRNVCKRQELIKSSAGFRLFYPWSTKHWVIGLILFTERVELQIAFRSVIPHHMTASTSLWTLNSAFIRNADAVSLPVLTLASGFWVSPAAGQDLWPPVLSLWHSLMLTMLTRRARLSWSSWSRSQRARATVLALQVSRSHESLMTKMFLLCTFLAHFRWHTKKLFTRICDSFGSSSRGKGKQADFLISHNRSESIRVFILTYLKIACSIF